MDIRNIAIIAHVDHVKRRWSTACFVNPDYSGTTSKGERAMDSNDLERERGITILAKCTSVDWEGTDKHQDTPGHADSTARASVFYLW